MYNSFEVITTHLVFVHAKHKLTCNRSKDLTVANTHYSIVRSLVGVVLNKCVSVSIEVKYRT